MRAACVPWVTLEESADETEGAVIDLRAPLSTWRLHALPAVFDETSELRVHARSLVCVAANNVLSTVTP